MKSKYQYVIIGSGIIGMAMARAIREKQFDASIMIIDKESTEAAHASSRNSGVLHAGFYYCADSLKAKFTVDGNRAMKEYCYRNNLAINDCGKLVVAQNEEELAKLSQLEERGKKNGSNVRIIDEREARELEPNVRTYKKALYSPDTASIDPRQVCATLKAELQRLGVNFSFETKFTGKTPDGITTNKGAIKAHKIINCAGLYADRIAKEYGFGTRYTIIPFKGLYLKYTKNTSDVRMNIYPVPNLKNPFLGVHFTKTVDGGIKIGPTAIPALWRENYEGSQNFKFDEFFAILSHEARLFLTDAFGFRRLAMEEMRKYNKKYFVGLAQNMVQTIDPAGFTEHTQPGIRAQLLDKVASRLVDDFVVEADRHSVHILNAVSPAFTCAFPFAQFVAETFILHA
jgi:L-2-hydroxyglutarate oxidase LhgO